MDTDNKKVDENNITGGEKDTLHNAGVDLASTPEKEDFIDIDSAPKVGEDPDLKEIGLEFTNNENKEDLSSLKEKMDKQKAANSKPSVFSEPNLPKKPVESTTKEPVNSPTTKAKIEEDADINDLEKEFNQTVGGISTQIKNESLNEKILTLQQMLVKIKEKLGFQKKEVKEELENLKKVKEDIAEDIKNIKELEESEEKIEDQLDKVNSMKEEISSIEKEVEEELKY